MMLVKKTLVAADRYGPPADDSLHAELSPEGLRTETAQFERRQVRCGGGDNCTDRSSGERGAASRRQLGTGRNPFRANPRRLPLDGRNKTARRRGAVNQSLAREPEDVRMLDGDDAREPGDGRYATSGRM